MTFYPRTRKYLLAQIAVWLLLGLEIGLYYVTPPHMLLTTVVLVVAGLEMLIFTVVFMEFSQPPIEYGLVVYFLLALAGLIVGTLDLLMLVFFGRG